MTGHGVLKRWFGSATPASPSDLEAALWNDAVDAEQYSGSKEKYQAAVLEQYKIYLEMADRISARRALANTFFLTLNTTIFTLIGVFWNKRPSAPDAFVVVPFVLASGLCFAWYWLVRSYRQLNSAKYAVVGALERRLPASPYWSAEWSALGHGRDKAVYWPLTHLEQWVPLMFGLAYLAAFLTVLLL